MAMRRFNRSSGFSLVEVMVAVAVMAIVTSQLLLSFSQQHTSSLEHERTIEIQEEARLVTDVILKDLRAGGFMVPKFTAVVSTDGGTATSDALCISDPSVVVETTLPTATGKFSGGRISSPVGAGVGSVIVDNTTLDIDGDGNDDFAVNGGIIIGSGTRGHCAKIDAIARNASTSTISFSPNTLTGFTVGTGDVAVPALRYSVDNAGTLTRNNIVISNHIEDIQAEFGVDIDRNGTVEGAEFPIDDLDTQEFELVRNVRVHVTARGARAEPGFNGQFPAIANRVAGPVDNFKRRRITGDAILRNLR